jgi:inosine/xanthosine triphosphatase
MNLVAVGSINPVKIKAVKAAFKKMFPSRKWIVKGIKVSSGVSKQPTSDLESIKGARNRAKKSIQILKADYGVGIEGGLQKIEKNWFDSGWVVILDKSKKEGIGSSIRMETPSKMMKLVNKGLELGEIDDIFFKMKNSKQKQGHFGLMTKNIVTREKGYIDGVISALSRFTNNKIFD